MLSQREQRQYRSSGPDHLAIARTLPIDALEVALMEKLPDVIAYSEQQLRDKGDRVAEGYYDAAEMARKRRLMSFEKPTGFMPDMKD
jgi:hypothetical protein